MINKETKNYVVESLKADSKERFEKNLKDLKLVEFMKQDNVELVKESIEKIKANVIASIPEGVPVPGTSLYVSCTGSGNEITVINISIKSKIKAEKKFKFAKSFVGENVVTNIANFFADVYTDLVIDIMAEDNLEVINGLLEKAAEDAGLDYKVSLTSAIGGTASKVSFISDDEVVFYTDLDRVFDIDDVLALQEPSEIISEEAIEEAKKQIADSFETAQTPEQLVAEHGGVFVGHFANISKNVKPMTMIKQVTNRSVSSLNGNKDAIGYYSEGDVFALVAKRDGNLEVILSPFNTETFRKEDVDVLAKIG